MFEMHLLALAISYSLLIWPENLYFPKYTDESLYKFTITDGNKIYSLNCMIDYQANYLSLKLINNTETIKIVYDGMYINVISTYNNKLAYNNTFNSKFLYSLASEIDHNLKNDACNIWIKDSSNNWARECTTYDNTKLIMTSSYKNNKMEMFEIKAVKRYQHFTILLKKVHNQYTMNELIEYSIKNNQMVQVRYDINKLTENIVMDNHDLEIDYLYFLMSV